jgi:hypothetical protein
VACGRVVVVGRRRRRRRRPASSSIDKKKIAAPPGHPLLDDDEDFQGYIESYTDEGHRWFDGDDVSWLGISGVSELATTWFDSTLPPSLPPSLSLRLSHPSPLPQNTFFTYILYVIRLFPATGIHICAVGIALESSWTRSLLRIGGGAIWRIPHRLLRSSEHPRGIQDGHAAASGTSLGDGLGACSTLLLFLVIIFIS